MSLLSSYQQELPGFSQMTGAAGETPLPRRVPRWPGLILAFATIAVLMSTMGIGFTRDEGYYFKAGELYSHWYQELATNPRQAITRRSVSRHWAYNPEHPPLAKALFGISWRLFSQFPEGADREDPAVVGLYHGRIIPRTMLGLMRESTAFRFPAVLWTALLVYFIYRMGALAFSVRVGVFAAIATIAMPRFFFNSHLTSFDLPVAAMWFFTVYAFWRYLARPGWGRALLVGLVWGLAIATKHNAYFIPGVLLLWWLPQALRGFSVVCKPMCVGGSAGLKSPGVSVCSGAASGRVVADAGSGRGGQRGMNIMGLRFPPIPLPFLAMLLLGPVVLYLLWPRLWHDPIGHWVWYFRRHFHHEFYWAYYFGHLYANPPFPVAWPWVMTLVTVPFTTTLLGVLGIISRSVAYRVERVQQLGRTVTGRLRSLQSLLCPPVGPGYVKGTDSLLLLNLIIPIAIFSTTTTPIFGGTKHMMPAMPFLALFAGLGFEVLCRVVAKVWEEVVPGVRRKMRGREAASHHQETTCVREHGEAVCSWRTASPLLALAMGGLLLTPSVAGTWRSHPDGPCYYNELLGGFRGMGNYKMQREFWGNSAGSVLYWVNANAAPNGRVFFHDTNYDSFLMYKRDGLLRPDIRYARNHRVSDIALFHHHAEFLNREQTIWKEYGTATPVYGHYIDGVPVLTVYQRPQRSLERTGNRPPRGKGGGGPRLPEGRERVTRREGGTDGQ